MPSQHSTNSKRPSKAVKHTAPPKFVELQLCKTFERPPVGDEWAHEIKFDGYRMQLRIIDGTASLLSRKGLDWSAKFPEIVALASTFPDAVLDGEVVALDEHGSPDFARDVAMTPRCC